ncbi:MAG: hypothetical protein JKY51_10105, partial [Opitutaceae bacterium]|nr:hypothetical protein [Opitutaceae bacterium]
MTLDQKTMDNESVLNESFKSVTMPDSEDKKGVEVEAFEANGIRAHIEAHDFSIFYGENEAVKKISI